MKNPTKLLIVIVIVVLLLIIFSNIISLRNGENKIDISLENSSSTLALVQSEIATASSTMNAVQFNLQQINCLIVTGNIYCQQQPQQAQTK